MAQKMVKKQKFGGVRKILKNPYRRAELMAKARLALKDEHYTTALESCSELNKIFRGHAGRVGSRLHGTVLHEHA
jgi:DNA polymerase III delta subunit